MAVVVQQMVFPQAAGVLFTADPVTSNRKVIFRGGQLRPRRGPGLRPVNADVYKVRDGEVVAKAVATKQLAIHASPGAERRNWRSSGSVRSSQH
jgi:phosphoenolpyruvate synthase/pyruvate phosphate dikinase